MAIGASAAWRQEMPGAEYRIYGEGSTKPALKQLAKDLGMTDRTLFDDARPTEEIAGIMAASDLAVVPKRASSQFGNEAADTKIMEFMSLGVPLIVSNTKIDTFYHDDSRVRFFESENEADLGDAMLELWSDPTCARNWWPAPRSTPNKTAGPCANRTTWTWWTGCTVPTTAPAAAGRHELAADPDNSRDAHTVHKTSPR